MGLDSSGYNTSALFQAKNYDPTNSALVNGLQTAATYDPTTQATSTPTSAARFLTTGLNSQNDASQDTASTTQNLQSNNGYGTLTNALSSAGLQSSTNAAQQGLTAANNNSVNNNYAMTMPTNSKLAAAGLNANQAVTAPQATTGAATNTTINAGNGWTVSQATGGATVANGGYSPAAQAAAATAYRNGLTQYSGASVVSVRTKDGNLAYYQFNPTSGGYTYVNTYDKNGQVVAKPTSQMVGANIPQGIKWNLIPGQNATDAIFGNMSADGLPSNQIMQGTDAAGNRVVYSNGVLTTYKADSTQQLDAGTRASAQLQTISGNQLTDANTSQGAALINQMNGQQIAAWNSANTAAYNTQQAAAASTAQSAAEQQALDYMTTHGGQLPPQLQIIANQQYAGNTTITDAQKAGIAAAQAAYNQNLTHAAALTGLQVNGINTKASDAVDQATMNSLLSQYASQGTGAGSALNARGGAYQAAALSGQAALNHEKAAATSYNSNLTNFATALNTQNAADQTATGNQLYNSIQGVQQIAQALSQEMDQLGTSARAQAQSQLDQLQNAVNNYQQAVREFGQGSANAIAVAKGILSMAAQVAAAVA